ncbi:serine protease [Patescibacteria group bacterium]|nr:MAG: serine protease [Patescibacteria group bacterium]
MEDLTKQQVVLLTLLVSIITSIATGIVTVSLMDQAPTGATHVINRVIEKTVEKVIPAQQGAAVITKETVVVKTEDQAVAVVENITPSLVKIFSKTEPTAKETFIGMGLVISRDGVIATDSAFVSATGGEYTVVTSSGTRHLVSSVQIEKDVPLARLVASSTPLISADSATSTRSVKSVVWKPAVLAGNESLKLGQSVIALSGEENLSVSLGNIRVLQTKENVDGVKEIISIQVSADSYDEVTGGPLLNLSGEVVGLKVSPGADSVKEYYVPASVVKSLIASSSNKP